MPLSGPYANHRDRSAAVAARGKKEGHRARDMRADLNTQCLKLLPE